MLDTTAAAEITCFIMTWHLLCKLAECRTTLFVSTSIVFKFIYEMCIFHTVSIESVGATEPEDLFLESVKVLKAKCVNLLSELNKNS